MFCGPELLLGQSLSQAPPPPPLLLLLLLPPPLLLLLLTGGPNPRRFRNCVGYPPCLSAVAATCASAHFQHMFRHGEIINANRETNSLYGFALSTHAHPTTIRILHATALTAAIALIPLWQNAVVCVTIHVCVSTRVVFVSFESHAVTHPSESQKCIASPLGWNSCL